MLHLHVITGAGDSVDYPVVRKIGFADLKDALAKGIDDFWAMPTHVIFLVLIYPLFGIFLWRLTFGYRLLPLLYPLVAGYALIGPFAAIGLYELSRQREQGVDVTWASAFNVLRCPSLDAIAAVGMILMIMFLVWLVVAEWLYRSIMGPGSPDSITDLLYNVFTTREGWLLIVVGNAAGFLFAAVVLTIGVVSFPMLLDRDVGAVVAIRTSIRAVLLNPAPMAAWGLIVAVALAIGSLPLFFGLAIVLPVLAHATWHLYRKLVER